MKKIIFFIALVFLSNAVYAADVTWTILGIFSVEEGDNGIDRIGCNGKTKDCGTMTIKGNTAYFTHGQTTWELLNTTPIPDPNSDDFENIVQELFSGYVEGTVIIEP